MDFSTVLLAVAVVLFVVDAIAHKGVSILSAIGLACFAGSFLVDNIK
jgi:hypothetical protein